LLVVRVALGVVAISASQAHDAGVSTSRIVIDGRTVDVEINALGRYYEQAAGVRIADKASGEVIRSRWP
jgi:hypothetical protein